MTSPPFGTFPKIHPIWKRASSLTFLSVDLSHHWFFQDADSVEFTRQKGGGLAGREVEQQCALSQLP